jgi:hypothetical protein
MPYDVMDSAGTLIHSTFNLFFGLHLLRFIDVLIPTAQFILQAVSGRNSSHRARIATQHGRCLQGHVIRGPVGRGSGGPSSDRGRLSIPATIPRRLGGRKVA